MNKELVFKKEMRAFDINVDDIKPDEHIFGAIEEAIIKMRNECLIDRLEVVLNNNLIDIKDKITDNRTILGCRLSYADLSKDVSFIVRQDNEPTYEQLQEENKILKENAEHNDKVVDKVNWENMLLKKENKQLKDNWNYIKKMLNEARQEEYISGYCGTCTDVDIDFLLGKMQELEGSDSDE